MASDDENRPQRIVIVGAGPSGLLLALSLLQRALTHAKERYHVSILERRSDPRRVAPSSRRTYPISLQSRGLRAIRSIPRLEAALEANGVWSIGGAMHRKSGAARLVDRTSPQLLVDRNQLVASMLERLDESARDCDGEGFDLSLRFDCSFGGLESDGDDETNEERSIRIDPAEGEPFTVPYDRLIAADGAKSAVRAALVSRKLMACEETYIPDNYRSLFVPRTSTGAGAAASDETGEPCQLASDRVHTWLLSDGVRMILCPTGEQEDCLHGVIIFAPDKDPMQSCSDADAVMRYFRDQCPRTVGRLLTTDEAEALLERPAERVLTVRCDLMAVGTHVVLLGDAAHAVSASVGQGCNSSLQDVLVLCRHLDARGGDWDGAVPAFASERLPEAHALRDLSDYSMPRSRLMWMEFFFRVTIGKLIRKWFPSLLGPLPMELIMDGEMAYTDVVQRTRGWIDRVRRSIQE